MPIGTLLVDITFLMGSYKYGYLSVCYHRKRDPMILNVRYFPFRELGPLAVLVMPGRLLGLLFKVNDPNSGLTDYDKIIEKLIRILINDHL